jgi:CubicO group peptidase (beta-lactamase class C family)
VFDRVLALLHDAVGPVFPAARLIICAAATPLLDESAGDCAADTLFDVASLTKPLVTTTLAMRLVDDGRLSLDHPLRPGVTVRHALCHATGLPAWRPLHEEIREDAADPRAAIVERIRSFPLEAEPGARSVYSDLGFILLGDALERAGGDRLDALFAPIAAAFAPGATFDPDPARCAPTRPTPPDQPELDLRGTVNDDNALALESVAGHAGLFATAGDVSALAAALIAAWSDRATSPIARPQTVRAFWTPSGVPGSTWCLGWDRPSPVASQAGARWPRDGVGHLGFTGCSLWIDPPRARWVVLLSNRVYTPAAGDAIKTFRPALHDAIVAALDRG